MTEQFDIFISHNNVDKPLIGPLIERLYDEFEIRSWLDKWDLHASAEWEPAIRRALESCRACAVVLGANGWGAYHVAEARLALERRSREPDFPVIPVLLPGADQHEMAVMGDFFQRTHRVDFSNGVADEEAFRRLVAAVRGEAPGPPPMTVFSINRAARQWEQAAISDKDSILYRGSELRDAQGLASTHTGMLSNAAVRFLSGSAEAEQRSIQAERGRTRRVIAGLIVGLMIVAATAVFALAQRSEAVRQASIAEERRNDAEHQKEIAEQRRSEAEEQTRIANEQRLAAQTQRQRADQKAKEAQEAAAAERKARIAEKRQRDIATVQRDTARSRELAAGAESQMSADPQLSVLLAVEAEKISHTDQGERALRYSLAETQVRTVLRGPTDGLSKAVFSPDGKRVAIAGWDNTAIIWDAQTGAQLAVLSGHTDSLRDAEFSPDGSLLVTASDDKTARIWDVGSGRMEVELSGHKDGLRTASFSPSGRFVLTTGGGAARVWRVKNGHTVYKFEERDFYINRAVFSPDGNLIAAAGSDKTARVWDFNTGQTVSVLRGHNEGIRDVRFSRDSKRVVTASDDKTARVWDATTGAMLIELRGHNDVVNTASFSPDGEDVVTASNDYTARVWELSTGKSVTLGGHVAFVHTAEFSPDGNSVVTASSDKTARVWRGGITHSVAVLRGHGDQVETATFSPDGRSVLTASWDGTARVWLPNNGRDIWELKGHTGVLISGAFSPDGRYVVTAGDNIARVWDLSNGQTVAKLVGHEKIIWKAVFSPDGKQIATTSEDGTVRLWDAQTGRESVKPMALSAYERLVSFSPDGKLVAANARNDVHLYDASTGQEIASLKVHAEVKSISFSPDGKLLVTGSFDGRACLWDMATKLLLREFTNTERAASVNVAVFSPDSRLLYTGGFGPARLWDVRTGKIIHELKGRKSIVGDAAFSPDGKYLATPGEVWDVGSGSLMVSFGGQDNNILGHIRFSPDGKLVLTTGGEGPRLWEVETGRELLELTGHTGMVHDAALSADGRLILTVSADKTARVYTCEVCGPVESLFDLARTWVRRELSPTERTRFLHVTAR